MTDITAGASRIDLGRVVNRTFGTIGRNFLLFFLLTFVLYAVPYYGLQLLLTVYGPQAVDDYGTFLLINFVGNIIASLPAYVAVGAVTHGAIISFNGGKAELGDCLSTGIGRMLPLFLLGFVTTLAIVFASLLLIVPGIIVAVMLVVAVPAMVVERLGVSGSMSRSADLTKGNRWTIFFLGLICLLIVFAILFGVGFLAAGGASAEAAGAFIDNPFLLEEGRWFMVVLLILANVLSMIISSTGIASLYYELRTTKEGATSSELAKVFD